jgi:hypothetical protein
MKKRFSLKRTSKGGFVALDHGEKQTFVDLKASPSKPAYDMDVNSMSVTDEKNLTVAKRSLRSRMIALKGKSIRGENISRDPHADVLDVTNPSLKLSSTVSLSLHHNDDTLETNSTSSDMTSEKSNSSKDNLQVIIRVVDTASPKSNENHQEVGIDLHEPEQNPQVRSESNELTKSQDTKQSGIECQEYVQFDNNNTFLETHNKDQEFFSNEKKNSSVEVALIQKSEQLHDILSNIQLRSEENQETVFEVLQEQAITPVLLNETLVGSQKLSDGAKSDPSPTVYSKDILGDPNLWGDESTEIKASSNILGSLGAVSNVFSKSPCGRNTPVDDSSAYTYTDTVGSIVNDSQYTYQDGGESDVGGSTVVNDSFQTCDRAESEVGTSTIHTAEYENDYSIYSTLNGGETFMTEDTGVWTSFDQKEQEWELPSNAPQFVKDFANALQVLLDEVGHCSTYSLQQAQESSIAETMENQAKEAWEGIKAYTSKIQAKSNQN